ncbi:MAG: hypothetical protein Fur0041_06260 [Bacteroidia bacterium]
MKKLFTLVAIILGLSVFAQNGKWSRVRIYTGENGIPVLAANGITVDHGEYKKGCCLTTDLSSEELAKIVSLGFSYEILIDDVQEHYKNQNAPGRQQNNSLQAVNCNTTTPLPVPANFTLGSMGGFFTLAEVYWHLDNMATLYPNIFKAREVIDSTTTTHEGRYIYWVKISDNPATDETEPEMLYTAAHHAREPAGVSQLIMYMYYLLENYQTNPEIQYIVNNTELYFVPLVNPDGYDYNYQTNPNGGGMWRKNRRDNQDGSYGVDLNRNYAHFWGYDNTGSSPNTSDDTYRGPGAASEPETQNIETLCVAHQFKIAINFHTYSNLLICPWGYAPSTFTPDSALFMAYGSILTADNAYQFGTPDQTVGYVANGNSDDWMYGEQTLKPKILAMTPEAGDQADGFWPAQNRIVDICMLNIPMDLNAARLLLSYGITHDKDSRFMYPQNGYVHFDFQRLGLDSPASYTVSIIPVSSYITAVGSPRVYTNPALLQLFNDSISYTLSPSTPEGAMIQYIIEVNNGLFGWKDTVTRIYGQPSVLLANNGNNITGWQVSGNWNTTTSDFYSPSSSITDSPSGPYGNNANTNIRTTSTVSLANCIAAQLTFYARWDLEAGYDYAQVQVSTDNGATWNPLCGKYTTNNNNLDNGNPTYTGVHPAWVKEEMSLDDYLGQNILIRYRLRSDFFQNGDGFYFDDLLVEVLDTTASSVQEYNGVIHLSAMPNPCDDYIWVNTSERGEHATIEVYDQFGRFVKSVNTGAGSGAYRMTTFDLAQGVYFIRVNDNGIISTTEKITVVR